MDNDTFSQPAHHSALTSAQAPSRRSVLAAAGLLPLLPASPQFTALGARPKRRAAKFAVTYTDFAAVTPSYLTPTQCWNSLGLDDQNRVYINWTSTRSDGREDTALFRYTPSSGRKEFLGSFIDVATRQNNLARGEQIPKGHTRIVQVGRKLYMGSQASTTSRARSTRCPTTGAPTCSATTSTPAPSTTSAGTCPAAW